jgi:hyperosmotically inducible protein
MKPIVCIITFALGASAPVVTSAPAQSAFTNRRDEQGQPPNAQNQSAAPEDLKRTQGIRRALVKNKSLSTSAKNVQIITVGGTVTLRGSVKSAEEKALVLETARKSTVGANFDDRIEIAP